MQFFSATETCPSNYCCTRVLLYEKMLKETENKETRLFATFFLLIAFRLGGGGGLPGTDPSAPPPPWLRL